MINLPERPLLANEDAAAEFMFLLAHFSEYGLLKCKSNIIPPEEAIESAQNYKSSGPPPNYISLRNAVHRAVANLNAPALVLALIAGAAIPDKVYMREPDEDGNEQPIESSLDNFLASCGEAAKSVRRICSGKLTHDQLIEEFFTRDAIDTNRKRQLDRLSSKRPYHLANGMLIGRVPD